MVEINNQRKAFLNAGVVGENDNGRQTEIIGCGVIMAEALLITPITLANLSTLNQNKSTGARRYQLISRWWISIASLA